ncbi:MAG TPA: circadian clock KaiB family protein [Steroidobacteraceae bacterium]
MTHKDHTRADFEAALARTGGGPTKLCLYVAGMGPRSTQAIADVQRLCADYGEHCDVEIIDIYQQPAAAAQAQVVAVPTLARERPLPRRRIIGTIGNVGQVARSLDLRPNAAKLA